jgi:hypothetical protein
LPQLRNRINFNLDNDAYNEKYARHFLSRIKEIFWETDTHIFFRTGDYYKKGYIMLIAKSNPRICVSIRFENEKGVAGYYGNFAKLMPWRKREDDISRGLVIKTYFDMLHHYDGIVSDRVHSFYGQKLWEKIIHQAQDMDLSVRHIDGIIVHGVIDRCRVWGNDNQFLNQRILIFATNVPCGTLRRTDDVDRHHTHTHNHRISSTPGEIVGRDLR